MADNIEKQIILKVDASGVTEGVNQAKKSVEDFSSVDASKSIKTLKQELKEANFEAQRIANSMGTNNQTFVEAAKRVADLKDKFQEYNQTVQAFNPDNKLEALVSVARGATGAIQGVAGGMAFLGVESEKASETMVRLQGLMNFAQALNSVDDIKNGFKNLSLLIGLTGTTTEGTTIATKGFGLALKSIGIGLLISAIAFLISNWDDLKKSVVGIFPSLGQAGELFNTVKQVVVGIGSAVINYAIAPIKALIKVIHGDFQGAINEVKNGMNVIGNYQKGAAQQSAKQRLDEAKQIANDAIKRNEDRIKVLKAAGKDTAALERANFTLRKAVLDKNSEEYKQVINDRDVFEATTRKKNYDDEVKLQKEADQKRKEAAAKEKAAKEKELKEQEDHDKKFAELVDKGRKIIAEGDIENFKDKEKEAQDREDRLNKLLESKQNSTMDLTGDLTPDQMKERAELIRSFTLSETEIKLQDLDNEYKRKYDLIKGNEEAELGLSDEYEKAKTAIVQSQNEARYKSVATTLQQAADLVGKQTIAGKALAISSALINTYAGATEALRAKSVLPEPFATAQKVISVATIIATGLKAVKEIMKVQVAGAGGSSTATSVSSPVAATTAPTINSTLLNPSATQDVRVTNAQDTVVRSYIVDRDLQNNEDRKRFLNNLGSI